MMATKLKKIFKYTLITYLSFFSFSSIPTISDEDNSLKDKKEESAKAPSLDTGYFNQIPKNDYIVGSGDSLRISISRDYPELFSISTVDGEGTIYLPRINRIYVKGLSIKELNSLLTTSFKEFVKYPKVEVEIDSYRPIKVLVNGEVDNPGVKTLEGAMTVNNSFSKADIDNLSVDKLLQSSGTQGQEKLKSLLQLTQGSNLDSSFGSSDISALPNAPSKSSVNYYFPTVIDAIRQSGGITEYSDLSSVEVIRKNNLSEGGGKIKTSLNLMGLFNSTDDSQNIRIYDGDKIFVNKKDEPNGLLLRQAIRSNINPSSISVLVAGRVNNPGLTLVFRDSTLNDAIDLAGGAKILKGPVRYVSFNNDGTLDKRKFAYARYNKRGSFKNPYLSNGDVIIVGNSPLSITNEIIREFTAPFIGIYSTYSLIDAIGN